MADFFIPTDVGVPVVDLRWVLKIRDVHLQFGAVLAALEIGAFGDRPEDLAERDVLLRHFAYSWPLPAPDHPTHRLSACR